HLLQGDPTIDLARAKEVALELLSTARVIPLQEALQLIKDRARAGAGASAGAPGAGAEAAAPAAQPAGGAAREAGPAQAGPAQAGSAVAAPAQGRAPVSMPGGNMQQSRGGDHATTGADARDQALTPADKQRGAEGAAAKDLGPMLVEVQGLLAEI